MPSRETLHLATPWCPDCRCPLTYDHAAEMWGCPVCSYQTTEQSLVHRQSVDMRPKVVYRHRRADGWPYCPQCDEDELWSNADPATEDTIVGCYRCDWTPESDRARGVLEKDTGNTEQA